MKTKMNIVILLIGILGFSNYTSAQIKVENIKKTKVKKTNTEIKNKKNKIDKKNNDVKNKKNDLDKKKNDAKNKKNEVDKKKNDLKIKKK